MTELAQQAQREAQQDEEQALVGGRTSEQRAEAALALRLSGAGYPAIARTLEYVNAAAARHAVEKILAASAHEAKDVATLRAMTSQRLERLLRSVWSKATDPDDEEHLAYSRTALAIIDRHARLVGADAPQKMEVYTPDQEAQEAWIRGMLEQVGPKGIEEEADIIDVEFEETHPDD